MASHASQIGPDHFMLSMPDEAFSFIFGEEWFIVEHVPENVPPLFAELFELLHEDPAGAAGER